MESHGKLALISQWESEKYGLYKSSSLRFMVIYADHGADKNTRTVESQCLQSVQWRKTLGKHLRAKMTPVFLYLYNKMQESRMGYSSRSIYASQILWISLDTCINVNFYKNIKYVSQRRVSKTMNFDTNLIKIGQEITKLWVFEDFNMDDIGAAILNI